jgi:homoaconitase/3-isopropylmalate dehydratase large subunit
MSSRRQAALATRFLQVVIEGDAAALRQAAALATGKRLRYGVRAFVIPADNEQYAAAIDNGAIKTLIHAGFTICAAGTSTPALAPQETLLRYPDNDIAGVMEAALN